MPERFGGLTQGEIDELFTIYAQTNDWTELRSLAVQDERFRNPNFHSTLRGSQSGLRSRTNLDEKLRESLLAKFHFFFSAQHYDAYFAQLAEAQDVPDTRGTDSGDPDLRLTPPRSLAELALTLAVLADPGHEPLIPDWDDPGATAVQLLQGQALSPATATLPAHRPSLAASLLFHCPRCDVQWPDLHRYYLDLSDRAAFAEPISEEMPEHFCPVCGSRRGRAIMVLANEADIRLDTLLAQCRLVLLDQHTRLFVPPQLTTRQADLDRVLEVRLSELQAACEKVFPTPEAERGMTLFRVVYSLPELDGVLTGSGLIDAGDAQVRAQQLGAFVVQELVDKVRAGVLTLDMAVEHARRIARSGTPLRPPITLFSDLGVPPEAYLVNIVVTAAFHEELDTPVVERALLAVLCAEAYRRVGAHGLARAEMVRARTLRAEAGDGEKAGLVDRQILEADVERAERERRYPDAVAGLERLVELWRSARADPPRTPLDQEILFNQLGIENRLACAYENADRVLSAVRSYRSVESRLTTFIDAVDGHLRDSARYLLSGAIANQGNLCRRLRLGLSKPAARPEIAALFPGDVVVASEQPGHEDYMQAAMFVLNSEPGTVEALMSALTDRAVERTREALGLSEQLAGHYFAAVQANVLTQLLAETGSPEQETYLRTAIRHAKAGSALHILTDATARLVELRQRAGALAEAAELGEDLLRLLLRRRVAIGAEASGEQLGEVMLDAAARVADLRDRLGEPDRVVAAIETAKCSLLSLELERSPLRLSETPGGEAATAELRELEARRDQAWAAALTEGDGLSLAKMDAVEARIAELKRDLRARHPRYDAMCRWSTVEPFELADLHRFLRRRSNPARVVGFFVHGDSLWWYHASGSQLVTGTIPLGGGGAARLSAQVIRLRGRLMRGQDGPVQEIGELLAPAFGALPHEPGTPTLICPHGPLLWLPWALLPADGGPLVEQGPLSTVPGLSVLPVLPDSARLGEQPEILVVADPQLGGEGALPGAAAEAAALRSLFGERCRVLTGAAATSAAVIDAAGGRQIVHFACHGDYGQRLVLAGSSLTGENIVEDLDLRRVVLVNLAACDSGLVRPEEGTEIDGIARAFLSAGAAAVLGSLWPLDDDAARVFSSALYEHLVADGEPSMALRQTQTDCRRGRYGPVLAQPRHWAAYVLVGAR